MSNRRLVKEKKKRHNQKKEFKEFMNNIPQRDIIAATVEYDTVSWLYMLHEKRGFGKKRLEECLRERNELADAVNEGYLDYFDMKKVLLEDVGVEL